LTTHISIRITRRFQFMIVQIQKLNSYKKIAQFKQNILLSIFLKGFVLIYVVHYVESFDERSVVHLVPHAPLEAEAFANCVEFLPGYDIEEASQRQSSFEMLRRNGPTISLVVILKELLISIRLY
jgi:hypothetical protein